MLSNKLNADAPSFTPKKKLIFETWNTDAISFSQDDDKNKKMANEIYEKIFDKNISGIYMYQEISLDVIYILKSFGLNIEYKFLEYNQEMSLITPMDVCVIKYGKNIVGHFVLQKNWNTFYPTNTWKKNQNFILNNFISIENQVPKEIWSYNGVIWNTSVNYINSIIPNYFINNSLGIRSSYIILLQYENIYFSVISFHGINLTNKNNDVNYIRRLNKAKNLIENINLQLMEYNSYGYLPVFAGDFNALLSQINDFYKSESINNNLYTDDNTYNKEKEKEKDNFIHDDLQLNKLQNSLKKTTSADGWSEKIDWILYNFNNILDTIESHTDDISIVKTDDCYSDHVKLRIIVTFKTPSTNSTVSSHNAEAEQKGQSGMGIQKYKEKNIKYLMKIRDLKKK